MSKDIASPDLGAPAGTPIKPPMKTSTKLLIGCALLVPLTVCCAGIGSAVAIPAFIRYVKQSKATEAPRVLGDIAERVRTRCVEGLPTVSAGPVPLTPGPEKQEARFTDDPGFEQLRFEPFEPLFFSYSVISVGDGSSRVVAEGDLDGDGTRSRFTVVCSAACECGEVSVENELE